MADTPEKKRITLTDLEINYSRKDKLGEFIEDNIEHINNHIGCFTNDSCEAAGLQFGANEIKSYLQEKFIKELDSNPALKDQLWQEFESERFVKIKIKEIATKHIYYESDLSELYEKKVFERFSSQDADKIIELIIAEMMKDSVASEKEQKYSSSIIKPTLEKALFWAFKNGFSTNLNNMESGLMTANAGDSAQFLFLARAILAGYNCSNVDVRSSRYDAVIDQNDKLFRVQIKGITSGTISFKDRNRGGKGIDSKNARNKGKRITSKDCDIYVAVDKQFGICYIIPTSKIDEWNVDSKSTKDLTEYKENWKIIDQMGAQ